MHTMALVDLSLQSVREADAFSIMAKATPNQICSESIVNRLTLFRMYIIVLLMSIMFAIRSDGLS